MDLVLNYVQRKMPQANWTKMNEANYIQTKPLYFRIGESGHTRKHRSQLVAIKGSKKGQCSRTNWHCQSLETNHNAPKFTQFIEGHRIYVKVGNSNLQPVVDPATPMIQLSKQAYDTLVSAFQKLTQ